MCDLIFDTRYTSGVFWFESMTFAQADVGAFEALIERGEVAHLVDLVFEPGSALYRSRRSWSTRDDAERAMSRFLAALPRS